jgi:tRNA pseudouridine55 synthase
LPGVKIGHTGTLDPLASGVLPICIGDATKLSEELTSKDKIYKVKMLLRS